MENYPTAKIKSLIEETISLFNLDLQGMTVLTEAANGCFFVTPVIAAMAGAKVIAVTKDSAYGSKEDVQSFVSEQAQLLNVEDKITFVYGKPPYGQNTVLSHLTEKHINDADIITNSGFVRPINKSLLNSAKKGAVIAGMYEDWEIRKEDIDFRECREKHLPVVAVNEQSEVMDIFRYVGCIALKMMFECNLEASRSKVLIISTDKFGSTISDVLTQNGAKTALIPELTSRHPQLLGNYDAVILADCTVTDEESNSIFNLLLIKELAPHPLLIHLAGKVDYQDLTSNGITCYPRKNGIARRMSETLAYLGIRPVIELQTAGLSAAAIVCKELRTGTSYHQLPDRFQGHHLVKIT